MSPPAVKFRCPCCQWWTLDEPDWDVCPVCRWEDDTFVRGDPDKHSGPNHMSLREGQKNYAAFGACDERSIGSARKPTADERHPPSG